MRSKITFLIITSVILLLMLSSCATIWDVQGLQKQIDTIKASITNTQTEIKSIKPDIENLKSNYAYVKNTVDSLANNSNYYDSLDALNEKVEKLQKELNSNYNQYNNDYSNLQVKYSQLNSELTGSKLKLESALNSISQLKNSQSSFSNALSTMDSNVNKLVGTSSKVSELYSRLKDLDQKIGSIEKSINDFSTTSLSSSTIKLSDFVMLNAKVDSIKDKLLNLNSIETKIKNLYQKEGMLEANISRLQANKNSLNIPYTYVIVQKGDTLYKIAKAYKTSISDIESLNNKIDANIYEDELLKLPIKEKFVFPFKGKINVKISYGSFIDHSLSSWVEFGYIGNVLSILPGRVDEVGENIVFGKYVRLYCGNYIYITYGNLQSINVKEGDWIEEKSTIGYANNLILSISINGDIKDPLKVLALSKDVGTVTYYTEWDDGKNPTYPSFRITRMGTLAKDWETIAADLTKMPLGTIVYIPYFSKMPNKGIFIVEDCGGAINGNDIDIFMSDIQKALKFKKNLEVYCIKKPNS